MLRAARIVAKVWIRLSGPTTAETMIWSNGEHGRSVAMSKQVSSRNPATLCTSGNAALIRQRSNIKPT